MSTAEQALWRIEGQPFAPSIAPLWNQASVYPDELQLSEDDG